jgi:nucleoside-diphosphate-sugar epimerase
LIHLIGATGRSGQALCQALRDRGAAFTPVIRNPARWNGPETPAIADLKGPGLAEALHDARTIISCAHARHIPSILAAAPHTGKNIFLGSTRKFTRWPDAHGNGVLAGEAAFLASGRPGVLLHPTMIYGATGEDNVQRLAALLRRLPIVPLPGGGRALVQPIHQSDVTRAILAAVLREWPGPESIVIAGPSPLPYADFVRAVAAAAGLPPPRMLPVPAALLLAAAPFTRLPGVPRIHAAEIRRLLEDKAFDIGAMRTRLGFDPIPLAQGLAATFAKAQPCP